jgi:hypothetical protein
MIYKKCNEAVNYFYFNDLLLQYQEARFYREPGKSISDCFGCEYYKNVNCYE